MGYRIFSVAAPLLCGIVIIEYLNRKTRRRLHHPPSPKSWPLVGNLFSTPSGVEWLAYMKLGQLLNSDIIYLSMLGQRIVVLNSAQAASDLLDKRSALYSDRMCPPMLKDPTLFYWPGNMSVLGYTARWRQCRRVTNDTLNSRAVVQYYDLLGKQAHSLLQRLTEISAKAPAFDQVKEIIFFTTASSLFRLSYGYHLQNNKDPFFVESNIAVDHICEAAMYTNFLVNVFPVLSYIPQWLPGMSWKRTAERWRIQKDNAMNAPYEWTKAQVNAGIAEPSMLSRCLQNYHLISEPDGAERDGILKDIAMVLYGAGTDTSSNVLIKFIAAMVLNPTSQSRAQQELDDVIGPVALPSFSDRERLPYVRNLIKEVLRWHPVAPLGLPHMCYQDDNYRGYDIEKGTIVIGNLWAMSRDDSIYPDPEAFNPDRYLDPTVPDIPSFGWGRRKCPGAHLAEASLFITIASMLSTLTFSKKKEADGVDVTPIIKGTDNAVVLGLNPFEFDVTVRSEKHRRLAESTRGH
ncbi:O-methylsterigmatocystin oxidoreductase [Rhizoctonia solani]|uniref:O-methylsterigmatocystin oxidoreductase n=1 Tax=Rhizoctonia solani TaxID=456999 RepID=A0A0K6FS43_9AGAM|nr:O-methylsterigmatocystin oxidoreductase [Rhizoctonia solani]